MADSVYKVIELVGTSTDSWESAAASAIDQASSTLRGLRVAEVKELDVALDEGGGAESPAGTPVLTGHQIRSRADGPP